MGEGEAIVLQKSLGSLRSVFRQQSFVSRGAEGGFCAASERRDRSLGGCLKVDMNTGWSALRGELCHSCQRPFGNFCDFKAKGQTP